MSINNQTEFGVTEIDGILPTDDLIEENVLHTNEGPLDAAQMTTFSDAVDKFLQGLSSENNHQNLNQTDDEIFYQGHEILFGQQLVLSKEFRTIFDIRYKTDYFPRSGSNASKAQSPRYLLMQDEAQEVIIKFPENTVPPPNPGRFYLQIALLTVPYGNQYYLHENKFQLDHKRVDVVDENPFYIPLTKEHFRLGEIRIKLVLIKTHQSELESTRLVPMFCETSTSTDQQPECKSPKNLIDTYQLKRAMVAFTLGYRKSENEFVQFTSTTVLSNQLIEKEKPAELDEIICPHCSGSISIREMKENEKRRKRSLSTSDIAASKKR